MGSSTPSSNWGAVSLASINASAALGFRGTIYEFRNMDDGFRCNFLLASAGFGMSFGFRVNQILRNVYKVATKTKSLDDPALYTKVPANRSFSASDLNLASGAEATAG